MSKRTICIRVDIEDSQEAAWIWKSALGEKINGVVVTGMSSEDLFEARDLLDEFQEYFIQEESEGLLDAIEAHCNGGFATLDEARAEARNIVSIGTPYKIVSRSGTVFFEGVMRE